MLVKTILAPALSQKTNKQRNTCIFYNRRRTAKKLKETYLLSMNSRIMDGRQKNQRTHVLFNQRKLLPSFHSFVHPGFHSFIRLLIDFPIHLFFGSFIHSLTHPSHPFIHSLVLSFDYFFHSTIGIQDSAVSSLLILIHVHVLFHINRVLVTQSLSADGHVSLISKCVISSLFTHFVIFILLL